MQSVASEPWRPNDPQTQVSDDKKIRVVDVDSLETRTLPAIQTVTVAWVANRMSQKALLPMKRISRQTHSGQVAQAGRAQVPSQDCCGSMCRSMHRCMRGFRRPCPERGRECRPGAAKTTLLSHRCVWMGPS